MERGSQKLHIELIYPDVEPEVLPVEGRGTIDSVGSVNSIVDDSISWLTGTLELFLIANRPTARRLTYPIIDLVMQSMPNLRKLEVSGLDEQMSAYSNDLYKPSLSKIVRSLMNPCSTARPTCLTVYDEASLLVDRRRISIVEKCRKLMKVRTLNSRHGKTRACID